MNKPKKWFRALFRKRIYVMFLLLLQILLMIFFIVGGSKYLWVNYTLKFISLLVSLHIISKHDKVAYKLTWVFLILLFPLFGGLFYLVFTFQSSTRKFSKYLEKIGHDTKELYKLPNIKNIKYNACLNKYSNLICYLENFSDFPLYDKTESQFLSSGEMYFEELLESLRNAKKYIFLESFIIKEGIMWNSILEILKQKVKEGVIVRVIYDDVGCFLVLPSNYPKILQNIGIECIVFNKFRPLWTTVQNNRDHRKIAIIDGNVAFTGGINFSDEYINTYERFGHWKDAGMKITGKAAWSFTLIFLQMWSICKRQKENYLEFYPFNNNKCNNKTDGFIQPYADSPMDKENIGEHVYLHMINKAKRYLYINTPYLIIDDSMVSALKLAAKSGVDVRITVPYRWDKRFIHFTTRSYYRDLIKSGVKIYEYSKGFIHSKSFISDDEIATIGTINLDFRSLYLHFECGMCIYDAKCINDMKKDYVKTLEVCKEITLDDCKGNIVTRFLQDICKLFAPLM